MAPVYSTYFAKGVEIVPFGNVVIKFKVGDRHFSVHEDLICASSTLFRDQRLHRRRKAVSGECGICLTLLNFHRADIVFCRRDCGQNFHESCYKTWSSTRNTCPMCRGDWIDPEVIPEMEFEHASPIAAYIYVRWLYSKEIPPLKTLSLSEDIKLALALHSFGSDLEDEKFVHIMCKKIAEAWQADRWKQFISHALETNTFVLFINRIYNQKWAKHSALRFLVRGLVPLIKLEDITNRDLPRAFLEDITAACLGGQDINILYAEWLPAAHDSDHNSNPDAETEAETDVETDAQTDEEMET